MGRILGITASAKKKIIIQSGVIVSDPDAQSFVNNAAITVQAQGNAVNDLTISLKAQNLWSKLIVYNPKVGGTAASHKLNLKDPRNLDLAYRYFYGGAWIHSASGAKANGTNAYANTYCNLSTLGLVGNFSFGYYITVASTLFGDKHSMGAYSSSNNWIGIQHNFSTELLGMAYGNTGLSLIIPLPNNEFFAMTVNGTVKKIYHKNLISTGTINGTALPNLNLYEGALNVNNTYYNGLDATYGSSFIATGLTDAEIASLKSIITTFETALGRNV